MSDFFQNGTITTIHNLHNRSLDSLESELKKLGKRWPMTLILPSLFSELEGPALGHIIDELCKVDYLEEIVIGLDRANEEQFKFAKEYFSRLPQRKNILWNDGPRLRAIDQLLADMNLAPTEHGKGRNVWYCFGYFLAAGRSVCVGLHDCDILDYDRSMVARLFYPVMDPTFGFKFCKGYYYRASQGKFNGRVVRLLVTPLVRALKEIVKDKSYLEYIDSFRYPLAGEFSMFHDAVRSVRIPNDWGLEIGVLSEIYRNYSSNKICQADIADSYDHKHQELSADDIEKGLSKMSVDICKAFYRKLASTGEIFTKEIFNTLKATYHRHALDMLDRYSADAIVNGFHVDRHLEEEAIELFARNIMNAGEIYLQRSTSATPYLPSWNRIMSALPEISELMIDAVHADNE